jgi:hypothetical protein
LNTFFRACPGLRGCSGKTGQFDTDFIPREAHA